ncbi:hypothetical protein EPA93_29110 [Ktedonosporobacter rubrisoli]|uniref:Type II secretion system protein GspE N-terminal domain-containing protein n=1 Tax=Ktedonosporobacter rubrisoli TaxID=2509675 RepID=A0A4V0YZI3_KTERU|nr:hypothetical protein [Ktedonosporobacter rubrisoli]QBD79821.1 hypothetical protein EPA93_29110 [Ktedonosporobacter rubrisoli]
MATHRKRREASLHRLDAVKAVAEAQVAQEMPDLELCQCPPLSSLHVRAPSGHVQAVGEKAQDEALVPISGYLNERLRSVLEHCFPRLAPLSVLLLHVSQLEHIPLVQQPGPLLQKRKRYHAPAGLLEQILANVRRAIRSSDELFSHEAAGAAIVLPDVDERGAYSILERVFQSISLLQAETVIPPLTHETSVLLGIGSYPEPGASLEHLLYHTGLVARRFTLRPALSPHLWSDLPHSTLDSEVVSFSVSRQQNMAQDVPSVPFMDLPRKLPARLKQLIPYAVACQLRCAPVGRDHHCLTVAMANPARHEDVQRLRELTGMTIFPVACKEEELAQLLAKEW